MEFKCYPHQHLNHLAVLLRNLEKGRFGREITPHWTRPVPDDWSPTTLVAILVHQAVLQTTEALLSAWICRALATCGESEVDGLSADRIYSCLCDFQVWRRRSPPRTR